MIAVSIPAKSAMNAQLNCVPDTLYSNPAEVHGYRTITSHLRRTSNMDLATVRGF